MAGVPVDIEFVIGGDYRGKLGDVKASIAGVGDASAAAAKKLRQQLAESKSAVSQLERDVAKLEQVRKNAAPGKAWMAASKDFESAKKALEEEKNIIADLERRLSGATQGTASFRTEQLRVVEQMRRMRQAGQENTAEYEKLKQKLGELATVMRTTNAERTQLSTGGSFAAGMASGVSGLTGAMSAFTGAMGVVNAKSEEFAKMQTRIQSLMAITIGMQQVATTLHQTSAFRINIVTKAKQAWAAAVRVLNVQLGISIGLSKVLMASGIGLLIAGIGVLVSAISTLAERSRKAGEELKKFAEGAASHAGKSVAAFEKLAQGFKALGNDMEAQEKFILTHKKAFEELGYSITSVADAQKLLIENKEKFVSAQIAKAKALAASEMASGLVEESIATRLALEKEKPTEQIKVGGARRTMTRANPKHGKLQKKSKELEEEIKKFFGLAAGYEEEGFKALEGIGVEGARAYAEGTVGAIKQAIAAKEKAIEELSDKRAIAAAKKEIEALQKQLDNLLGKDTIKKDNNASTEASEIKAASELEKLLRSIHAQTTKLQLELQEDGLKKRLAALDNDKEQELAKIEERNKAIVEAYNRKHPTAKASSIADIDPDAAAAQKKAVEGLEGEYANRAQKVISDYVKSYESYTDKRRRIEEKFTDEIAELTSQNTTGQYSAAIEEMRKQRSRELHKLEREAGDATKTITRLFSDMSGKSVKYMEAVAEEAEAMVKFMNENETFQENDFGISEDDFLRLKKTPAELKEITEASKKMRKDVDDTKTGFEKFVQTLKKMGAALESGSDAEFAQAIQEALGYAQGVASALDMAAEAMKSVAEATDNDKLKKFAETISTATSAIKGAGQGAAMGAQIGGGYGAIIGALAGGVLSLVTSASEAAVRDAQEAAAYHERIATIERERVLAALELKRLADERLRVEDEMNKSRLEVVDAEKEILKQKQQGAEDRVSELTKKLEKSTYTAVEHTSTYDHRGIPRNTYPVAVEVEKSILDKVNPTKESRYKRTGYDKGGKAYEHYESYYVWDEESIDRLRALREQETSLKEEDKAYIDEILAAWEDAAEYADEALEKEKERKQLLTGTTQDGLLDGLKKGLSEGKKAFADFAGDAEDILREALLSAVTASVSGEALSQLYEELYSAISDGSLTEAEVEKFKSGYAQIGANMEQALAALNQAGIDIAGGNTSLTGAVKTITEQSASLLAGQLNGIRVNVAKQLEAIGQLLAQVQRIRNTTDAYLPFLARISDGIDKLNGGPLNQARAA
jgi:chromosome segregation ATPase